MTGFRSSFDAHWPTVEIGGLRLTGLYIGALGFFAIVGNMDSDDDARLFAYPTGAALIVVGILAFDRSREDLVTGVVTGIAAIVLTLAISASYAPDPEAMSADAYPFVLVLLAVALFGLRAFRGAFRRRRHDQDRPESDPA